MTSRSLTIKNFSVPTVGRKMNLSGEIDPSALKFRSMRTEYHGRELAQQFK